MFGKELTSALNELQTKMATATKREMASYREALVRLDDKESDLYDDFKSGILEERGYRKQVEKIKEQRLHFTGLLEKAQVAINNAGMETVQSTIELAKNARTPDERTSRIPG